MDNRLLSKKMYYPSPEQHKDQLAVLTLYSKIIIQKKYFEVLRNSLFYYDLLILSFCAIKKYFQSHFLTLTRVKRGVKHVLFKNPVSGRRAILYPPQTCSVHPATWYVTPDVGCMHVFHACTSHGCRVSTVEDYPSQVKSALVI